MNELLENAGFKETDAFNRYFIMTVDVDGWSSLLSFYGVDHDASQADAQVDVVSGVSRILTLFEKHGIRATFFVTGEMARLHPKIVEIVDEKGHEVACHGLFHWKDEYLKDREKQEHEIKEATRILEDLTGHPPVGFRAPCLRANEETFNILSEIGYLYDSSIIPTFIPGYYGKLNWRFKPYWLNSNTQKETRKLLEIPVSVNPIFIIPLSAAWMRNLGAQWVKFGVWLNFFLNNPVTIYVHPRDVLPLPRVNGVPWHIYRNIDSSTLLMLDEIFSYVKKIGASFITAEELTTSLYEKLVG